MRRRVIAATGPLVAWPPLAPTPQKSTRFTRQTGLDWETLKDLTEAERDRRARLLVLLCRLVVHCLLALSLAVAR